MDLRLTEILCCPRCGPAQALVLLADRVEDRRVLEGLLGCPGCGGRYPVRDGLADLRAPAAEPLPAESEATPRGAEEARAGPEETLAAAGEMPVGAAEARAGAGEAPRGPGDGAEATRLAALIGMGEGGGARFCLVVGPGAGAAPAMSGLVPETEVVAAGPGVAGLPEAAGVSRLALGRRLPFRNGSLRGVALTGPAADLLLEEGVRVLDALGRILLQPAPPNALQRLGEAGARALAREGDTVVAARAGR